MFLNMVGLYIITFPNTNTPHIMEEALSKHTNEDRMNGGEDENPWFGMEESMTIYTIPCNLNFHYIKLHNFKILLVHSITLYFH